MLATSLHGFYAGLTDSQRATAEYLRDLILSAHPGIQEGLNWGVSCFRLNKWFIYINALKTGAIDLCFLQAAELTDESGLLEARGRKMVKSVVVTAPGAPSESALLALIFEAIEVNLRPQAGAGSTRTKV